MGKVPVLGFSVAWSVVCFGLKRLTVPWCIFRCENPFFILEICLKDAAVTEAPKEVMTILFHCAALFRINVEKCKNFKIVMFRERQIQSITFCSMMLFYLKCSSPPTILANLIFNSKYFRVLSIQTWDLMEELTLLQRVTGTGASRLFFLQEVIHRVQTHLPKLITLPPKDIQWRGHLQESIPWLQLFHLLLHSAP